MAKKTGAGWDVYQNVGELLTELDLNDEDMAHARQTTEDHVRAWHLAQVRAGQEPHAGGRALGGSLDVVADFGDRECRLT